MNDYQNAIIVNQPINKVYTAITENISDWWSSDLTGSAAFVGDNFNIAFGKTRKTFEIVEAIPNEKIIWKCVKAYIDMASLKNKAEWEGTEIIWTLNADNQETILTFLHKGLNSNFECYDVCEAGWDQFLASLKFYLTTGKGTPFLKVEEDLERKTAIGY